MDGFGDPPSFPSASGRFSRAGLSFYQDVRRQSTCMSMSFVFGIFRRRSLPIASSARIAPFASRRARRGACPASRFRRGRGSPRATCSWSLRRTGWMRTFKPSPRPSAPSGRRSNGRGWLADGQLGVWIVRAGRISFGAVELGIDGEAYVEVLAGLRVGDRVVTGPADVARWLVPSITVRERERWVGPTARRSFSNARWAAVGSLAREGLGHVDDGVGGRVSHSMPRRTTTTRWLVVRNGHATAPHGDLTSCGCGSAAGHDDPGVDAAHGGISTVDPVDLRPVILLLHELRAMVLPHSLRHLPALPAG